MFDEGKSLQLLTGHTPWWQEEYKDSPLTAKSHTELAGGCC